MLTTIIASVIQVIFSFLFCTFIFIISKSARKEITQHKTLMTIVFSTVALLMAYQVRNGPMSPVEYWVERAFSLPKLNYQKEAESPKYLAYVSNAERVYDKQPPLIIHMGYNPENAVIDEKQMVMAIGLASETWKHACGIEFQLNNEIKPDGIIKWSAPLDDTIVGKTRLGDGSAPATHFVLRLNPVVLEGVPNGMFRTAFLTKVLIHEMGHVIGLDHSLEYGSLMDATYSEGSKLTRKDVQRCQLLREQWQHYS